MPHRWAAVVSFLILLPSKLRSRTPGERVPVEKGLDRPSPDENGRGSFPVSAATNDTGSRNHSRVCSIKSGLQMILIRSPSPARFDAAAKSECIKHGVREFGGDSTRCPVESTRP